MLPLPRPILACTEARAPNGVRLTPTVDGYQQPSVPNTCQCFEAWKRLGIHRSELVMAAVLAFGAGLQWWGSGRGCFGWVIGVALATAIGQIVFVPYTNVHRTLEGWGYLMLGLCVLRLIVLAVVLLSRGGRRPGRPDDGPGGRDARDEDLAAVSPPGQAAHNGQAG